MDSNNYQRFSLDRISDKAIIPYQWILGDMTTTRMSAQNKTGSPNSVLNYPFSYPQHNRIAKSTSSQDYHQNEVISPIGIEQITGTDSLSDHSVYSSTSPQSSCSLKSSRYTIRSEYDPEKDYYSPSSPSINVRSSLSSSEAYNYPSSVPADENSWDPMEPQPAKRYLEWGLDFAIEHEPITPTGEINDTSSI